MLTRWDPFREIVGMRQQMDRMLNDWLSTTGELGGDSGGWQRLPLDVSEKDDAYIVRASVAGIKPEELEINVQNNMLTIQGETKSEEEHQDDRWHLRERRFGKFQRSIGLPSNVDPDQIDATYENGVLTLTLPKSEEAKPRRISVQSNGQRTIEGQRN